MASLDPSSPSSSKAPQGFADNYASSSRAINADGTSGLPTSEQEITSVAVLAVPSWMSPSDFLAFVAPAAEGMKHLRLIRDRSPNRTMVVIQFREPASALEFIEEFNGRPFNAVEVSCVSPIRYDVFMTASSRRPATLSGLSPCKSKWMTQCLSPSIVLELIHQ